VGFKSKEQERILLASKKGISPHHAAPEAFSEIKKRNSLASSSQNKRKSLASKKVDSPKLVKKGPKEAFSSPAVSTEAEKVEEKQVAS
jgi:hypothetical protein